MMDVKKGNFFGFDSFGASLFDVAVVFYNIFVFFFIMYIFVIVSYLKFTDQEKIAYSLKMCIEKKNVYVWRNFLHSYMDGKSLNMISQKWPNHPDQSNSIYVLPIQKHKLHHF